MDQPDAAYPLVRMPGQVVAALRKRNKGTPDHRLHDEIHRVQKDLLFLYFLHKQVNLHVLQQEAALRLRLTLLIERLRNVIYQIGVADDARLARLGPPDDPGGRPPQRWDEKTTEDRGGRVSLDTFPGFVGDDPLVRKLFVPFGERTEAVAIVERQLGKTP